MFNKFLILLMLIGAVNAANFGSTTQHNPITIKENQSYGFTLLFWTSDEESQKIVFDLIKTPSDFSVNIDREEINISKNFGNEMVYTAQDYISATSVNVFFDQNAKPGKYNIIISAKKLPTSGELLFAQERIFNLTVIVEGKSNIINIEIPVANESSETRNNYNFLITIVIIIFISVMIYRYS